VVVSFGWMTAEALRAYPDYISYMNQLASAHPHWWYLSDSNVEWGDDARALADYLHAHGETEVRGRYLGRLGEPGTLRHSLLRNLSQTRPGNTGNEVRRDRRQLP